MFLLILYKLVLEMPPVFEVEIKIYSNFKKEEEEKDRSGAREAYIPLREENQPSEYTTRPAITAVRKHRPCSDRGRGQGPWLGGDIRPQRKRELKTALVRPVHGPRQRLSPWCRPRKSGHCCPCCSFGSWLLLAFPSLPSPGSPAAPNVFSLPSLVFSVFTAP